MTLIKKKKYKLRLINVLNRVLVYMYVTMADQFVSKSRYINIWWLLTTNLVKNYKNSLKIPKGQSESINQRRTDNTMDQKTKDKKTNNDLQNTTHKTKDGATTNPTKRRGELRCSGRVSTSCSTSGTCRVNLITNLVIRQ